MNTSQWKNLCSWLEKTYAEEVWFVEPRHCLPKIDGAINIAVLSHFSHMFSTVALGHLSLYHRINRDLNCPGIADRVFLYDPIMNSAGKIKSDLQFMEGLPTFERQLPLNQMQLLCVSLTNPDNVTIILQLMRLGGIPLRCEDRLRGDYPIVLAGGPGCCNPEPFVDYFDIFCMGDGAELTAQIVHPLYQMRRAGTPIKLTSLFKRMKESTGMYIPSLYRFQFKGTSVIRIEPQNGAPEKVTYSIDPPREYSQCSLLSNGEIAVIVPNYGCKHQCAYCQFSEIPYREFKMEPLLERVRQYIRAGISKIIVNSATLTLQKDSDNCFLSQLADTIKQEGKPIKVFIGSLRFDELSPEILDQIDRLGTFSHTYFLYTNGPLARSIALAPESGSRSLMRRLYRPVDPWLVLKAVDAAVQDHIMNFILYYIVGIESETKKDRDQIAAMASEILNRVRNMGGSVILKINPLLPTPGTACQRFTMPTIEQYRQYISEIEVGIVRRVGADDFTQRIKIISLPEERLQFEAVISRADRRVGPLIEWAYLLRNNGRDPDKTTLSQWLDELGLRWKDMIAPRPVNEILPWRVVDPTSPNKESKILSQFRQGGQI